ncbi:MAG: ATP-binding protein [Pseudomonadales bacterium]
MNCFNIFDRLELEDTDLFKKAVFDFTPGLHVIYGLNKIRRNSRRGNGAGKSFLMSQIRDILFGTPVVGESKDRTRIGRRSLFITMNDKQYEFRRQGTKLTVLHKGQKVARTSKELKQWISKFPITVEDFNGHVYLDSRVPHPLVMGSSTDRKKFLTKFFNLDKIDIERKLIKAELDRLKVLKTQRDELDREYQQVRQLVKDKPKASVLKARLEKLKKKLSSIQVRAEQEMHRRRVLDFVNSVQAQLVLVKQRTLTIRRLTKKLFRQSYDDARESLRANELLLKDAKAYELWLETSKHYRKAASKLSEETVKLVQKYGALEIKKQSKAYLELRETVALLKDVEKPEKPKKVAKPETSLGELTTLKSTLEHQLQHAEKFGKGACPTCGQDVKVKDPAKLRKQLKRVTADIAAAEDYAEYVQDRKAYKREREEYDSAAVQLDAYVPALKQNRKWHTAYKELRDLPSPPERFTGKKVEVKVVQRMVDEDRNVLAAFDLVAPNLKMILEFASMEKIEDKSDFMSKVEELTPKVAAVQADLEVVRTYRKRIKAMKARLEKLDESLKDVPALKLLMDAYGDKAMKRMAIKAISSRLMKQVNKYASKIFTENFRFEMNWDTADLNILVHRINGRKTKTTDVRQLSGAEYRIFSCIVVMALLAFVPPSRRSSLMVLDEPMSNMHTETHQEEFCQLLDVMTKVIPSIVLITPEDSQQYPDAKCYTVVKRNGDSTIVKGHPSTIKD